MDFNNPDNWNLVLQEERVAQKIAPGNISIIPFEITLSASILAIRCFSSSAESHWTYAGKLVQRFDTNLVNYIATADNNFSLELHNINLVSLLQAEEYKLIFTPAKWHRYMKLSIWKYLDS
jgi:hypothetical protein